MPSLSILFVPANRIDLAKKAANGPASAICLDLEDSIVPAEKGRARENLVSAIEIVRSAGKTSMVRINSEAELLSLDLQVIGSNLDFVVLPKAGSTQQINMLAQSLDRMLGQTGPDILCLIESGSDLDRLRQSSEPLHARVKGMALGTEDLSVDLSTTPDAALIVHCFYELALLCRRWDIALLGYPGSIAEFNNLGLFESRVVIGVEAGARGGFCIHPKQIDVLNSEFTTSPE
jgi:citrate lyase subunit beta/citryl-CoA lyase